MSLRIDLPAGTPVGTPGGIVHLLAFTSRFADDNVETIRAYAMCDRLLRGRVAASSDEPTCQTCIDNRDVRAANAAGFNHPVNAYRVSLGRSNIAGPSGTRYGCVVQCYGCPRENGRLRVIWKSNEPGQMKHAQDLADQHFLEQWRASRGGI